MYAGYIERQQADIDKQLRHGAIKIPVDFNYDAIVSLSNEVREKLKQARPPTIAQAAQISGVTPAAIGILLVYLKKNETVV